MKNVLIVIGTGNHQSKTIFQAKRFYKLHMYLKMVLSHKLSVKWDPRNMDLHLKGLSHHMKVQPSCPAWQ